MLALSGVAGADVGRRPPAVAGCRHRPCSRQAGATPASVFAERWFVAEARRSAATEDAAAVAEVTFVDFEAALAEAL